MYTYLTILICLSNFANGKHFIGGTLSWAPVDPYDNSTPVVITITQTYFWTYPYVKCASNVPISSPQFVGVNATLICVVDCSTDGGYSNKTIKTTTDCISASSTLGMMISERSTNVTLGSDAHFYLANTGTAWTPLNSPPQSGLEWSIITSIDIRPRPDGFINSSPVVKMISPQYVFANKTTEIQIPVSDANVGDDVRCRWSTYTPGYRRRKRSEIETHSKLHSNANLYKHYILSKESLRSRKKRACTAGMTPYTVLVCDAQCAITCGCGCAMCDPLICTGSYCTAFGGCLLTTVATTIASNISVTTSTKTTTSTNTTSTINATTTEVLGTLRSTSSYPHRQAIDECGDICYPNNLPSGTNLSNCTISFNAPKPGVWYGLAVQVEDFIDTTSTTPMSSVPIQFLIYVLPTPTCSLAPVILPLNRCLEVQVGVSITFNISVINQCNQTVVQLADLTPISTISGMARGNLTTSSPNSSLSYVRFAWTPQSNQIGSQELCTVAYTTEKLQSEFYCITFTVKNSSDTCTTTTTTSTSSSSTSATGTTTSSTISSTSTSTSSTSIDSSSSTTSSSTSTTTGRVLSANSSNLLPVALGLGLGLGLLLCCTTCLLSLFLCCRFGSGALWRDLRRIFWKEKYARCETCQKQFNNHSFQKDRRANETPVKDYREEYINDGKSEQRENSFYRYLRQSNKVSPSDLPFPVTRRSTFLSTSSGRVVPNDIMHKDDLPNERLSSSKFSGSLLMQKYMKQNEHEHQLFN